MVYKLLSDLLIPEANLPIATNGGKGIIKLTKDLGNTADLPYVTGLQGNPVDPTAPGGNRWVLAWNSGPGRWEPYKLGYDDLATSFTVSMTRQGATPSAVDVGANVINPSFTLGSSPDNLGLTAATLTDPNSVSYNVLGVMQGANPVNYTVSATFNYSTVSNKVFNLSVTRNGSNKPASVSITWGSKGMTGSGSTTTPVIATDLTFIGSQGKVPGFTVPASNTALYYYFAWNTAYGTLATVKTSGGTDVTTAFTIVSTQSISINSTTQSYYVYRSVNQLGGLDSNSVQIPAQSFVIT